MHLNFGAPAAGVAAVFSATPPPINTSTGRCYCDDDGQHHRYPLRHRCVSAGVCDGDGGGDGAYYAPRRHCCRHGRRRAWMTSGAWTSRRGGGAAS